MIDIAQYTGSAAGIVLVMGYWLKTTLKKVGELENLNDELQAESKNDLRDILPLLNETSNLLKDVTEDGNAEVLEHLKAINTKIENVQCRAKD
ncbi:MAG: hypothetical protein GY881_02930 [Gammaproteobacteria bacterium]|nr:hypothetical protein [Gammaproteobacteria bacterium]